MATIKDLPDGLMGAVWHVQAGAFEKAIGSLNQH